MGKQVANVSPEDTQILNNIQKRISLESQLANKVDWSNYIKSHNSASESMKGFLTNTDYAEKSLANYQVYLEKTGNTTSKFSSFTSKAGSLVKSFGAGLANMGMGMLAGLAINGAFTLLDNIVNYQDKLIEKGEQAKSTIDETMGSFTDSKTSLDDLGKSLSSNADNIKNTGDAIDSIAKKYVELSNGVSKLNNENKSLSSDEYQSYLDISNQLAEQFPSLVSGYDAQGNAILNLGNNADSAANSLKNLYDAQMLAANVEIGNDINTVYDGAIAQVDQYEKKLKDLNSAKEEYERQLGSIEFTPASFDDGVIEFNEGVFGDNLEQVQQEIQRILTEHGIQAGGFVEPTGLVTLNIGEVGEDVKQELAQVLSSSIPEDLNSNSLMLGINDFDKQMVAQRQLIAQEYSKLATYAQNYLSTSSDFVGIGTELQNAIFGNLDSLDYSIVEESYGGDLKSFLTSELIVPLSSLAPETQSALSDLLSINTDNLNLDEYQKVVFNALNMAFPNDTETQNRMKQLFGFDNVTEDTEINLNRLKQIYGDAVDDLSLDELEEGFNLVVNDGFSGTFNELRDEIENAKALAATSIDLNARTNMDAIEAALESVNAGADYENAVTYLKKAKDLFDRGLVGTDDFKSIATYLSPTSSDDPVNFAENYTKAVRYLTEDASGVQNFLNDLQSKGYAALETMSDGTQKWTYDIKDLEDAASDMGIGFEFMMDMFGRLEDYGFSNNFVGSIEDGAQRISELSSQLVEAESELARLESNGSNLTYDENGTAQYTIGDQAAIDQQRERVNALKNDIFETQDAMEQLVDRSADEYAQQVDAAKQAISSLAEERQKILDESTYGDDTQNVADLMEQEIRDIASKSGLELDSELNVKVNADDEASAVIDDINKRELLDKHAELYADDEATGILNLWNSMSADPKITSLSAEDQASYVIEFWNGLTPEQKEAYINGEITITDSASGKIQTVDGEIQKLDKNPDVTISATDNANSVINSVRSNLASLDGTTATTYLKTVNTTENRTINYTSNASTGGSTFNGPKASGTMLSPALASGTAYNVLNLKHAYASGSVALSQDEQALVNELGTESIIRAGQWSLLPGGMHIESLKKGDIILNASQTKALLQYGRASGHARAYASGTLLSAYAGGSGGGTFWGNAGSSGSSGSYTSGGVSSARSSSGSSSASDAAKEFEETIDWIEMAIDRLERAIDTLDLKASSTYRSWSERNQSLSSEISKVTEEINLQQQGYNRYLQQANSVGLSWDWASKVQNGEVDISTVTDEDLADKVSEYQQWLKISGHVIYFIAGTSPKPCFATT